ncbi:MAG: MFS transporter [Ardenticatenaceae bacterium]|nr:MFS transporter [Ardenticatenaceae bacterium]
MASLSLIRSLPTQKDYWAVGLTHFFVDLLNSSRNLIVALLAVNLGLSNVAVAATLVIYNIGSALAQPLFGWMADRIGPRWLVIGGIGWMCGLGFVTALTDGWVALIAITLMGIGSGAFHPSGTSVATQVLTNHRNQATAVFFLLGQMGLFVGPIVTGVLIDGYGYRSFVFLPAIAAISLAMSWRWVINPHQAPTSESKPAASPAAAPTAAASPRRETRWLALLPLLITIICYSSIGVTLMTYLPKLLVELSVDLNIIGILSGLYMAGGAIGGYVGGVMADRVGGKPVIIVALGLAVLPLFFAIPAPGLLRMLLLFLGGFFAGMPHSILVLTVQSYLPNQKALAAGLVLGFMFFGGSIGSAAVGQIADTIGLGLALQGLAVLPFIGGISAIFINRLEGRVSFHN